MKIGDYVRFDYHKITIPILIGKITEEHYDEIEKYYYYSTDKGLVISEDNLTKEPSKNIMDLIEIGDYVNGFPVLNKENNEVVCGLLLRCKEQDIKSIVTKEQFEAMKYKIGG